MGNWSLDSKNKGKSLMKGVEKKRLTSKMLKKFRCSLCCSQKINYHIKFDLILYIQKHELIRIWGRRSAEYEACQQNDLSCCLCYSYIWIIAAIRGLDCCKHSRNIHSFFIAYTIHTVKEEKLDYLKTTIEKLHDMPISFFFWFPFQYLSTERSISPRLSQTACPTSL